MQSDKIHALIDSSTIVGKEKRTEQNKYCVWPNNGNNALDNSLTSFMPNLTVTTTHIGYQWISIHTAETGRGTGIDQHTDCLGF